MLKMLHTYKCFIRLLDKLLIWLKLKTIILNNYTFSFKANVIAKIYSVNYFFFLSLPNCPLCNKFCNSYKINLVDALKRLNN